VSAEHQELLDRLAKLERERDRLRVQKARLEHLGLVEGCTPEAHRTVRVMVWTFTVVIVALAAMYLAHRIAETL
jgi:hypothetical protein